MEYAEEAEGRKSVPSMKLKEGQRMVGGFVIDTKIPIQKERPFQRKHVLHLLNVGDSFFLPGVKANNFHNTVKYWSDKLGTKFVMRTVKEDGVSGVRVWRTE